MMLPSIAGIWFQQSKHARAFFFVLQRCTTSQLKARQRGRTWSNSVWKRLPQSAHEIPSKAVGVHHAPRQLHPLPPDGAGGMPARRPRSVSPTVSTRVSGRSPHLGLGAETCGSGLTGTPGERVIPQGVQGFKSLRLREDPELSRRARWTGRHSAVACKWRLSSGVGRARRGARGPLYRKPSIRRADALSAARG